MNRNVHPIFAPILAILYPPASQDVLRGMTLPDARAELARLRRCIDQLTVHLARYHYAETNIVGRNLRAERDGLEIEAHDLEARIASAQGHR